MYMYITTYIKRELIIQLLTTLTKIYTRTFWGNNKFSNKNYNNGIASSFGAVEYNDSISAEG